MGTIISSKKKDNGVVTEVFSDYEEHLHLKGHLDEVFLFTNRVGGVQTNISQRGKNEATKYFLIPRQFRKGFKFNNTTSCQRIDLKDNVVFIYVVNKNKVNPSKRDIALKKLQEKENQNAP